MAEKIGVTEWACQTRGDPWREEPKSTGDMEPATGNGQRETPENRRVSFSGIARFPLPVACFRSPVAFVMSAVASAIR
jgi:hypothetical protein